MLNILILEKDKTWETFLSDALSAAYDIRFFKTPSQVYAELKVRHYQLVLLDLETSRDETFNLLRWIKLTIPYIPIVVTSHSEIVETVVKTIKLGAYEYLVKPFTTAKIQLVVQRALEDRSLKNEIDYLRREQDFIYNFEDIIAESASMREIIKVLKKYSKSDSTILMTGETGTGKSFFSGTIHFNSPRRAKPFVKINCANIPEPLLESELFGHEKGSFTGADKLRIGRFEQAHGGTLFLDEIGEMSLTLQAKLLRVLEENCFERVGSNKTIYSDVRVILATNRDLKYLIDQKKFRADLYYRINVLYVHFPPLTGRVECIEPLSHYLLHKTCRNIKKQLDGFSPDAMAWIKSYSWPGNIRQLANTIERAVILEDEDRIQEDSLAATGLRGTIATPEPLPSEDFSAPGPMLATAQKDHIIQALQKSLWIQKDAAQLLGISPRMLNHRIKKLGIRHPRWRKNK